MRYYVDNDGEYTEVTDECPRGFKDVLFIARDGRKIGKKVELFDTALSSKQLQEMTEVAIADVPEDYAKAFGIIDDDDDDDDDYLDDLEENHYDDLETLGARSIMIPWGCVAAFAFVFWCLERLVQ